MIKKFNRVHLSSIDLTDEPVSPSKNTIKILKQKLPNDFFINKSPIYSSTSIVRSSVSTRSQPRKTIASNISTRDTLTAQEYSHSKTQDELILGVLRSARQIKKVLRKHSIEVIKSKANNKLMNDFKYELPPLLLRKIIGSS